MQELTNEQLTALSEEMKQTTTKVAKVREFLNKPVKDKHGKEKPMSLHMRTEYIAQAFDDLYEMTRNTIALHVSNLTYNISDLWKLTEKLKTRIAELEKSTGESK
jgi:hypothetical protein